MQRDSPVEKFANLRGCSWAYNEPESQSGYGITRYTLAKMGERRGFFGKVVQVGFHQQAIRMVGAGQIDAAAIDSQVLEIELRDHPALAKKVRVIEALGPSTIQPITAATRLPPALITHMQGILSEMHHDPSAQACFDYGLIKRLVAVNDRDYDDIRQMLAFCENANFMTLD